MISSFKHRGLKRLYLQGDVSGVRPDHVARIQSILGVIDKAGTLAEMDVATFRLHALSGDMKGYWSIVVRANWRIIFRFEDGRALELELIDYH